MYLCFRCYKERADCTCDNNFLQWEIDDSIFEVIRVLNKKGYYTRFCCGGHPERIDDLYTLVDIYIMFDKEAFLSIYDLVPSFMEKESSQTIRYTLITKDREYAEKDLQEKRDLLLKWANDLPKRKVV